ncbi:hypothetical protein WJX79_011002 [Trebouxia sp. C0005]
MPGMTYTEKGSQVPQGWNNTTVPFRTDVCIHQLFQQQAATQPHAECLVFDGNSITYSQLDQKTNRLAHYLQTLGAGRDIPVAVLMERSFDLIVAVMAVLKAGGAYLPMDPHYPEQRLAYMVKDAKAPVLLTHQGLRRKLPEGDLDMQIVDVDECYGTVAECSSEPLNLPCSSTDMMYLIYTSGSTGNPKGVMLNHNSLVNLIDWSVKEYRLSSQTSILLKTAVSFDPSVFEIFAPLALGGRLVIAKPGGHEDSAYVRDLITETGVTFAIMVPTALPFFLDACEQQSASCHGLKQLCLIGEAFGRCVAQRACEVLPNTEIHNIYGPTEATIWVSSWQCNGGDFEGVATSPIGPPMANTQLYVLDDKLQPVPVGEKGELYISGICLARGYKGQPVMTRERFVPNPFSRGEEQHTRMYKTGDEACWRGDGVLVFLGRVAKDQQVKLRGFRIELTEIDHHLSTFKGVQQAIAIVHKDSIGQQHLVAYVSPSSTDITKLRQHASQFLPKHMIPETFVLLNEFPRLPNGKADRNSLPEPKYGDMAEADYVEPSTQLEYEIQQLWSEVLGIDRISCSANFFQIGGSSLLAIMLASRIQTSLGLQIPASQLFISKTITELAAFLTQSNPISRANSGSNQQPVVSSERLTATQKSQGVYCTLNQEVMILSHQLSSRPSAFSMPFAVRLSGPLDVDLLQQALQLVIPRQEGKAGMGTKMVLPLVPPQVKLEPALPVSETKLTKALAQAISTAFDLTTGPMIHVTLIPLTEKQEHVLVVNMHYAVADGWSLGVLFKDISLAYNQLKRSNGAGTSIPELPISFLEHAQYDRVLMHSKRMADLNWWCTQLAGAPLDPLLTTDYPRSGRPNIGQNQGDIVKVTIPVKGVEQLKRLAQRCSSSLFVTVLAAFKVLLRRYSGRDDLVVGTPSSGRNRPDLEGGLVGCFVNLTALRTDMTGRSLTFVDLVQRVHDGVAAALAHADVPQMQVVAELARRQQLLAFNAIPYQVLFALHPKTLLSGMELDGVTTQSVEPIHTGSSKVDIFLELFEATDGSVIGHIEYDSSLWQRSSIVAFAAELNATLAEMTKSPEEVLRFRQSVQKSSSLTRRGSAPL